MGKIMRSGRIVVVLSGRFAGRKAVIVRPTDEGNGEKPFGHALVAGVDRYPRKVTKRMSKKKVKQRSKIKPFLKVLNYNHLMPTRYNVDIKFDKESINKEVLKDPMKKKKARQLVRNDFEEKYKSGNSKWFFQRLRF
ncbi:large ribosomal subunit protein eL27 [Lepeophtheirus salmonis]|uniref:Large ribosomal subunit protein eL27 n=1 Tax=Lepeophtheirus salmonis TaxID=72036 RepID=C1BV54_LEPSM|nr:60S ribosomal protein L27-like [Lepeophtheirus salmonis]ACO12907.1 60S ribosomal protein L27 [Lepeophtheirus salmonis]ADD38079.1 60S ribosomal protein L27 [Lepeophtheirus salmonis]